MTEQEFEKELMARIEHVENGATGVRGLSKRDYVQLGVIAVICLIGIIFGAFI